MAGEVQVTGLGGVREPRTAVVPQRGRFGDSAPVSLHALSRDGLGSNATVYIPDEVQFDLVAN